jgi:hypothetical protein
MAFAISELFCSATHPTIMGMMPPTNQLQIAAI